jgi:hypothetical protein
VSGLVIAGVAAIVNVCALDVPPPGVGFTAVIEAVPGVAIRAAVTVAVSCVEETYVVANAVAFHFTVEVETKFVPVTVKVNCPPPAVAQVGLIEVVVGTGLLIVNVCGFDVPPPGGGFVTVIEAVPAFATRAAVTVAVSCVEDTNVVVSAVPFQFTIEVETKFVPFTVKVNCGAPARHELGLIEVVVGTGLPIVNVSGPVPVPLTFVALRVMLNTPTAVGVPEINPVAVLTVKPAGNGAAPQVVIAWSAVIWYEYGTPMVPLLVAGLVIFGLGAATAVLATASTKRNGRIFFIGRF